MAVHLRTNSKFNMSLIFLVLSDFDQIYIEMHDFYQIYIKMHDFDQFTLKCMILIKFTLKCMILIKFISKCMILIKYIKIHVLSRFLISNTFFTNKAFPFKGNGGKLFQNSFASLLKRGRSTLKGKILLPMGKFFPFRVDKANSFLLKQTPIHMGMGLQESKQEVTKVVSLVNKNMKQ